MVAVTDELVTLLSTHVKGRARDGLVFKDAGRPFDYSNWLKRVWNRAVADAGIATPLPTPHDCRHSYGSWLAEQGVPPHEIAALMGTGRCARWSGTSTLRGSGWSVRGRLWAHVGRRRVGEKQQPPPPPMRETGPDPVFRVGGRYWV